MTRGMEMKKYRGIITAIMCLALVCSAGCSLGKNSSSSSGGETGYSYSSSKKTEYKFRDFTFELNDDFSVEDKKEHTEDNTVYNYKFSGKGFLQFDISDATLFNCDAYVYAEVMYNDYKNGDDETTKYSDIELEKLSLPGLDAACLYFTAERTDDGSKHGNAHLYITTEAHTFQALISYDDPDDRSKIKGLVKDLANSVKYISSEKLPTEPQTIDNEFIKFTYQPEWSVQETNGSKNSSDMLELKAEYAYARDKDHFMYPKLSIYIQPEDDEKTPAKLADKFEASKKQSKLITDVKRGNGEILGYNAEMCSFGLKTGGLDSIYTNYFFSDNGYVYTIGFSVHRDAQEKNTAEINELLKGLTIKKMSEEELEKKRQEREAAKYTEQTMANAVFSLDSKFKAGSTNGKYDSRFSNSADDMYLYICRNTDIDYDGAFKEYIEKKCSMISYMNDLDGVYSKKVILENNEFEDIFYVEKAESGETPKKHSIYLLDRGDEIWEFDISYYEKDEEKAVKYISEMLTGIRFQ